jgi:protein LSM12
MLFNSLPTRWNGTTIIVNDSVRVDSPYNIENCRAGKDNQPAEAQIRKVLEGYYSKKKQPNSGTRPVVPATPFVLRKGG